MPERNVKTLLAPTNENKCGGKKTRKCDLERQEPLPIVGNAKIVCSKANLPAQTSLESHAPLQITICSSCTFKTRTLLEGRTMCCELGTSSSHSTEAPT